MKSHGEGFVTQTVLDYDPNKGFYERSVTSGSPTTTRPRGDGVIVLQNALIQPVEPKRADNVQ